MKFRRGQLKRMLDGRGLTVREFARIAEVAPNTVMRGCRGELLTKQSWGRILIALTRMPPLEKVS
jgi:predicted transcriptional regulator